MDGKYYNIEFLRIGFTAVIALHHFLGAAGCGIIPHAYLAVEFFFILSGYLLMASCRLHPEMEAAEYTYRRIRKLYPHYLFSFLILFCAELGVRILSGGFCFAEFANLGLEALPEALFLQNIGIFDGGLNYPLWYLSVLVVGGHFLYFCIRRYEKVMVNLVLPLLIIGTFTGIFSQGDSIEIWESTAGIYLPLARGIADLGLGVLCCHAEEKLSGVKRRRFDAAYPASLLLAAFLLFSPVCYDRYALIVFPVLIICGFRRDTLAERISSRCRRPIDWFSRLCYPVYLNHALVIKGILVFGGVFGLESVGTLTVLYLAAAAVYSAVTEKFVRFLTRRLCSR